MNRTQITWVQEGSQSGTQAWLWEQQQQLVARLPGAFSVHPSISPCTQNTVFSCLVGALSVCLQQKRFWLLRLSGASHRIWLPHLGLKLPITVRSGRLGLRHLVLRMWMTSCFLLTVCGIRCESSEFLGPQSSSVGSGAHSLALG